MVISKSMSRPQSADSVRYGSSSVPRDGGRTRACSRAARGTTQGDTVVPKDLLRNGPSGTYSQDWMSRADQSLTRHTPNTCSVNLLAGTGSPGWLGTPTTKPSSASKSSRADGPNPGPPDGPNPGPPPDGPAPPDPGPSAPDSPAPPDGLDWPHGRRTGVPETITVPARPW